MFLCLIASLTLINCGTFQSSSEPSVVDTPNFELFHQSYKEPWARLTLKPEFQEKSFSESVRASLKDYLHQLIQRLSQFDAHFKPFPSEVTLFAEKRFPPVISLPMKRFGFNALTLDQFQYENELAAAIALEMAHQFLGHFPNPTNEKKSVFWMHRHRKGPLYSKGLRKEAVRVATTILRGGGFDVRGIPHYFKNQLHRAAQGQNEDEQLQIKALLDYSYREIARVAPLRNPVVRSKKFIEFKKKLKLRN